MTAATELRARRAAMLLQDVLRGGDADGRVARVVTEPRLVLKYGFLSHDRLPTLDLSPLAAAPGRRGDRALAGRIAAALASLLTRAPAVEAVLLDVSEGWFGTTVVTVLGQRFPHLLRLALQHGVMEQSGPESRPLIRRLRRASAAWQVRLLGRAVVGAGFGNLPFDGYACLGARDEAYIRLLTPQCAVVRAFAQLNDLAPPPPPASDAPDLVFLAQGLAVYGVRDPSAVDRQVFARLDAIAASRGWRVVVKLHPKTASGADEAAAFPRLELVRGGRLTDLLDPARTAVLSYASTGLAEAAYLGCRILAIRPDGVASKWFEMFEATISPDDFARWDADRWSRLAPGVID